MKYSRSTCLLAPSLLAALLIVPSVARQVPSGQKSRIHFAGPATYSTGGVFALSVATADLNGDGNLDLVVANESQIESSNSPAEVSVLLGNGDGTFQPAVTYNTGAYQATSVAVGDLRGDGTLDLVVANACSDVESGNCNGIGTLSVLLGNGDGTFQPAATYNTGAYLANSVALADLRGNGILDLVVANLNDPKDTYYGALSVLPGNGDGTFQPAVIYNSGGSDATSVAVADVNGDGTPDLIAANACQDGCPTGGSASVLLGIGNGTFQPAVTYNANAGFTYSVAVGDLRSDGILDLVVASFSLNGSGRPNAVGVMLGNGDGTFQPVVNYLASGTDIDAVTIGDVNGDGIPDLVVVDECQNGGGRSCVGTGEVSVLLGNGDGTFQASTKFGSGGYEGSAIAIGDVNGDGRPDLVVTNACGSTGDCTGDGTVAVLLNETTYTTKTALTSSPNPSQINQPVTCTATITSTPAVPNGETVTFYNGKTEIGTGTTNNGLATLTTSFPAAKTYTIKATYSGDPFRKASSGTVKQVVSQ